MNQDQVYGYLRTFCSLISASLITKGVLSADQAATLQTGVLGIAGLVFLGVSLYGTYKSNSTKGKLASVQDTDVVAKVELKPTPEGNALADSLGPKVVAK